MLRNLLAVFVGGAIGVSLRVLLDAAYSLQFYATSFGGIMAINAVGCFILGLLTAGLWRKTARFPRLRLAIGPGFLGGFTTFSGVMFHTITIDVLWVAALYIAASLGTSLFSALLGVWAANGLVRGKKARA